ncbi:MAG: ClpXP protease specificity-enhancing factor SspB [Pseudomonadota bacterium]
MSDRFHYGQLMHKALRGVMAEVLQSVAEEGLPGEHHFFITFDTHHPGVDIASHLRERYPEEMTIVIQHWFADLSVLPDRFSITLNFADVPEVLVIPFDAIKTFVDPSAEFGLRFDAQDEAATEEPVLVEEAEEAPEDEPPTPDGGDVVSLDKFRKH